MSALVNTEANGNYEPSEGEIIEYGKWLGMKLPEDNPFLWIAREGLKAPLPENWKACQSDKGELYYFNFKTGQSIWDHPMDEHFKELFKSEKQNPTPRSVAAGAKRKDLASGKKEGKGKKKHSTDKPEQAPVQQTTTTGAATTTSAERQLSQTNTKESTKDGATTVQPLKSVKVKKELPNEMRIEFETRVAEETSRGRLGLAQPKPTMLGTADLQVPSSRNSSSSSSSEPSPKVKKGVKPTAGMGAGAPQKIESPAAGGGSGLKSLRMLSENNNRNSPPNDSAVPDAAALKTAAVTEEKERVAAEAKVSLDKLKADLAKERESEEESIRSQNAILLKELRSKCEKERDAKINDIRKKADEMIREEQRNADNEMKSSLEQVRKELSAQKAAEIRRLKDSYKEQIEQEKRKMAEELAEKLEAFAREQHNETNARREAFSHSVKGSEQALEGELLKFTSAMVRSYEEAYVTFSKSISSSRNDFALRSIQQKEEAQRELDAQLTQIRGEQQSAIEKEKKQHQDEIAKLRATYEAEKTQIIEAGRREVEQIRSETIKNVNEAKSAQEKEAAAQMLADLRANQTKELEALKSELRTKAEEELKAAMSQLAQEHKERMASSSVPRGEPERSPSLRLGPDDTGASKAPVLDGNLLCANEAPLPEKYAALHDSQARDIKAVLTEALREVFAESPFTLPSPARGGGIPVSPSRSDPTAARRSSFSVPAALPSDLPSTTTPYPSVHRPRTPGIAFPVSFQEQRELVDGERRRVREGRKFVDTQRKNLEDRRQQLRRTRHQWKQDVLAAKEEGVRSSSKRGQLLNKVRLALEEQAQGLEHDEDILRESMAWLQSKEQRLMQLEQQIEDQERLRAMGGDGSTMNCSVDTAALVTGYFKPQRGEATGYTVEVPNGLSGRRLSQSVGAISGSNFTPFESPASTPVFSSALSRIERRLDEVTSLIHLQKSQTQSSTAATSPSHMQQQPNSRKISLTTPSASQTQNRHRSSRSLSKAAGGEPGRDTHVDPW